MIDAKVVDENLNVRRPEIWILEDEVDLSNILFEHLSPHYEITQFQDAVLALEKFKNGNCPSAIMTDIQMPNLNGIDFIKEIRKVDQITPICIMSGYADYNILKEVINYGVNGFIEKPFKMEQIFNFFNSASEYDRNGLDFSIDAKLIYEDTIAQMQLLLSSYEERYTRAENILEQKGINIASNMIEAREIVRLIKVQNTLNRKIEWLLKRVSSLKLIIAKSDGADS